MITELTAQQKSKVKEYQEKAFKMCYDTHPGNEKIATEVIKEMYAWAKLSEPEVVFVDSPRACQQFLNKKYETKQYYPFAFYGEGGLEGGWIMFYYFFKCECGVQYPAEADIRLDKFKKLIENSSFMVQLDGLCVVSRKPIKAFHNAIFQPHKDKGKAYEWADGYGFYYLNGVRVPDWLALCEPDEITIVQVINQQNVEVRREIIRKMGIKTMLEKGQGKKIDMRKRTIKTIRERGYEYNFVKGGNWWQIQQGDVQIEYDPKKSEKPHEDYEQLTGGEREITEGLWDINCGKINGREVYARYVVLENPSVPGVLHCEGVVSECTTVQEAHNWRRYKDTKKEWNPGQLT